MQCLFGWSPDNVLNFHYDLDMNVPCNHIEYYLIPNVTHKGPEYPLLSYYGL